MESNSHQVMRKFSHSDCNLIIITNLQRFSDFRRTEFKIFRQFCDNSCCATVTVNRFREQIEQIQAHNPFQIDASWNGLQWTNPLNQCSKSVDSLFILRA